MLSYSILGFFLCIPSSNAAVNPNVIKAHGLMVWAHFLLKANQF